MCANGKVFSKRRSLALIPFIAIPPASFAVAQASQAAVAQPAAKTENSAANLSLPPRPPGKTTVIGGEIRSVDPVRDQFKIKVFGGKPMTILFDARTQTYRDGKRIPLSDLRADEHASVETVLDGTNIFALSIHILSQSPEGETQGQVLSYNPGTGDLTISSTLTREPIKLRVPPGTPVVRQGQSNFSSSGSGASDLVKGTLVSITFKSGNEGRSVANRVVILAVPGSAFVFSGNISVLDVHSGLLVIVDPKDGKTYQVFFDPARFSGKNLHEGEHVRVTASFDGNRYVVGDLAAS